MSNEIAKAEPSSRDPMEVLKTSRLVRETDDQFLAALTPSLRARLEPVILTNEDFSVARVTGIKGEVTKAEAQMLLATNDIFRPSDRSELARVIGALLEVMPRGKYQINNMQIFAGLYVFDLQEYPIDIVARACRAIRRRSRWFPSIAEMVDECETLGARRLMWRRVLVDAASDPD